MRKLIALLCLVTACYRTTEWGSVGEYRGHPGHTIEQQVGEKQTASIDDSAGLKATVTSQAQCRSQLIGENLEEKQDSTKQLQGSSWMIVSSLLIGAAGAFGILFAAADANNQDVYGNMLPSKLSSTTRTELIVAGSAGVLVGIAGVVAVILLPSERRQSRWVPLEGDPKSVYTTDDPMPCQGAPKPVPGVTMHVAAKFDKGTIEYDVPTDGNGTANFELTSLQKVAGWCGAGNVTATILDQTWHGPVEGVKAPLEQITDEKARELAEACSH
jgi:hypothetical protein